APTTPAGAGADAGTSTGAASGAVADVAGIPKIWSEVIGELPLPVRSKWRGGRWVEPLGNPARFAVPNNWHQKACEEGRREVEQALAARLGPGITVEVVVEGGDAPPPGPGSGPGASVAGATLRPGAPAEPPPDDEDIDLSELRDADDVETISGVELLMREFGGGQLIEEEP
ncbi:MAG TPA: hypothetical protein VIL36_00845, partial [Acidimicrobiales bacterium]